MNKCLISSVVGPSLLVILSAGTSDARAAVTFGFSGLSNNDATDTAIGESQLRMTVDDLGGGQISFLFTNSGPAASAITDIYIDDDSMFTTLFQIIDADDGVGGHAGVDFSPGAAPPNLPAGNGAAPPFVANTSLSLDSDAPITARGVGPGEYLTVIYNLMASLSFADVLADIDSGDLRVGIHAQGFDGGGSESFRNNPRPIPEATSFVVWSLIAGLCCYRRRRSAA